LALSPFVLTTVFRIWSLGASIILLLMTTD
jgi:hypothetical protein